MFSEEKYICNDNLLSAASKMDQEPKKRLKKHCEGLYFPLGFPEEGIRSAVNYKPKKGDLFIVSYPKCGTTWMQHIVLLILRHGKLSDDPLDFCLGCPFLEVTGAEGVDYMIQPGAIKTHLPYHKVPLSKEAKYIYVCRNPKDCVVSYYYHMKERPSSGFENATFDEFFEYFVSGDIAWGDYFDHIKAWYEHKNDPNVYIVSYENLKKDIRGEVLKLAKFIGEEYEKILLNDSKILDDIIHYSSFEYMKKAMANDSMAKFMKGEIRPLCEGRRLPPSLMKMMEKKSESNSNRDRVLQFVRKGIVGDWKNHLNPDQLRRIEEREAEKTANSDVMSLWI